MKRVFVLFLMSCLILTGCSNNNEKVVEKSTRQIVTEVVGYSEDSDIISLSGNVVPTEIVKLSFEIPGNISDINVKEGDYVNAGQIISTLNTKDYDLKVKAASAQYEGSKKQIESEIPIKIKQAQTQLDLTKATYDRIKALYDVGGVSQSQMDEITAKLTVDTETLNQAIEAKDTAETNLKQAEAALDLANSNIKSTSLSSPIDGVILQKLFETGENIAAGYPVVAIGNINNVYIEVGVTDKYINSISKGQAVTAYIYGLEKEVTGVVEEIGQLSDPETRTFPVKILINNPEGELKPGMTSKVSIDVNNSNKVLIPISSVIHLSDGDAIYTYSDETKTVTKKFIETGNIVKDKIEVLSGLENGEKLVVDGQFVLHDGDEVAEKEMSE